MCARYINTSTKNGDIFTTEKMIFAIVAIFLVGLCKAQTCEKKVERLQAQVNELSEQVSRQMALIQTMQASMQSHVNGRSVEKRAETASVAFMATLDHTVEVLHTNQRIGYNNVMLNSGDAYASSGLFTAPVGGTYLFAFSIHMNRLQQIFTQLMINGNPVNSAITESFSNYGDTQGTAVSIVYVSAGEQVWVQMFHDQQTRIEGKYGGSSFCGTLLA
ncbi:collagen alpha-2(VIII) chain-like isoform X1 [Dreissena polymorpha]|uniref:C1q domain-containing protein n=1 Tax=Dreissena polymorpha TaxID=45954 RepID=A0A9D4RKZ3_DREPO|nr:collagen alpha-2(VIII) chain-like isoform X1 [Dreissena polymorpha]XP_052266663.1 collagen alpha-2(VIII) chain-like isoform X1 [Dreissena polymorpha]KAH3872189.1 hypothetical protein DPMN_035404 [Dreissena polymorpha]